ncbi:MAG: hypothetical protein ACRDRX_14430 [Pseudonocardiaceae bacterium]
MDTGSTLFNPVVPEDSLGRLGKPIGENNGESQGVYPLTEHPGWLLKIFKPDLITDADITRIDQLVELPEKSTPADRMLLNEHTSWPAARVTSASSEVYGVVLPEAPSPYWVDLQLDATHAKHKPLEIDWLATAPEKCRRRGIPIPSFTDRVQICTDFVAVAELLERRNLVYGDWSYANAFWSPIKHTGYIIDIDGCALGSRATIGTQNWDDPLASSKRHDTFSDRYGVALLLARCLTGERMIEKALAVLQRITTEHGATSLYDQVRFGVVATERHSRPAIAALLAAVQAVEIGTPTTARTSTPPESGVTGWVPVPTTGQLRARRPKPRPPRPTPPTARPSTPRPGPRPPVTRPPATPSRPRPTGPTPNSPPRQELGDIAFAVAGVLLLIVVMILLGVIFG